MLLWTLVMALAIPYCLAWIPFTSNPVAPFRIGQNDLLSWLSELDPKVRSIGSGGGGGNSRGDSYQHDYEYAFASNVATEIEMFEHLMKKMQDKMNEGQWQSKSITASSDYQSLYFYNSYGAHRVYIWMIPITDIDRKFAKVINGRSTHVLRVKWINVGYSSFHGRWPAKVLPAD